MTARFARLVLLTLLAACGSSKSSKSEGSADSSAAPKSSGAKKAGSAAPAADPNAIPPEMVRVPGATFDMGSEKEERPNQEPVHKATVGAFLVDKLETTVAEYEECVNAKACATPSPEPEHAEFCNYGKADRKDHPINCIAFGEASKYCEYRGKRLLREAEWELAARGTDGRRFPWGADEPTADLACWDRLDDKLGTCKVGSFPKGASPYGVLDMAGNVSEWTSEMYCMYTESPCTSLERVGRGGSWDYGNPGNLTTTFRAGAKRDHRKDLVGVRCGRDAP